MAEVFDESNGVEKLYEYSARLSEAKDKSLHVDDYKLIIEAVNSSSIKARQLAAQLIPRFFKFFPALSDLAVDKHCDLCEAEELGVRVHAIRGLPLFCKDTPEHVSKIVDILVQILNAEENVERDAVVKALLSLLRHVVKASLTDLVNHIESSSEQYNENQEGTLSFIRDKVFPLKSELLRPPELMERHITDLIKKSVQDVTGGEFNMFIDFLKNCERTQEHIEIIEGQAALNAQFNVDDGDHIERLLQCIYKAIPIHERGASSSKFLNYPNKQILPDFDKMDSSSLTAVIGLLLDGNVYMGADSKASGLNTQGGVYQKVHWLTPTIAMIGGGSASLYTAIKKSVHFILQQQGDMAQFADRVADYVRALLATGMYPNAAISLALGGSHGTDVNPKMYVVYRGLDANGNDAVVSQHVPFMVMFGTGELGMRIYQLTNPLSTIDINDPEAIKKYIVENISSAIYWSPATCGPPIELVFIPTPDRLPATQDTYQKNLLNEYGFASRRWILPPANE